MPQPALFFPPIAAAKRAKRLPTAGVCKIYCVPLLWVEKIALPKSTAGHVLPPGGNVASLGVILKPGGKWIQLEGIRATYLEEPATGDGGPFWITTLSAVIPGAAEDVRSTLTQLALQKIICIVQFPKRPGRLLGQMEMGATLTTGNTAGIASGEPAANTLQVRYTAALPPVGYSLTPTDGSAGGGSTGPIGESF